MKYLGTISDSKDIVTKEYMSTALDAAVPSWAKSATKPTYSLSELTADSTHRTVTDTEKSTWNSKLTCHPRSNYDVDTLFDEGLYMVGSMGDQTGSNCPSGNEFGSLLVMPYRQGTGNVIPDYATQIFIPNGDDPYANSLFFRSSMGSYWNAWQRVANQSKKGTVVSENADFAEIGEWHDGNPDEENRVGRFVTLTKSIEGFIIDIANASSDVCGVIVEAPAFSGNADDKYDSNGNLKKEYDYVALLGLVSVIDNGACTVPGKCMPDANGAAVPSSNNMGYNVISRIDATHVEVFVRPGADMLQRIRTDVANLSSSKQNTISDLATIRSGAALGATALQSFTETDPTVPNWAKQVNKPSYTANEVGALPNTTIIPSKTSDLTNDSGFLTAHQDISGKANLSGGNTFNDNQQFNGLVYLEGSTPFFMSKQSKIGMRATNSDYENLGQINISNAWYDADHYACQMNAKNKATGKYNTFRISHNGPQYFDEDSVAHDVMLEDDLADWAKASTKPSYNWGEMTDFAAESDVTVSSVTYHTYWKIAPTSSNQVYGIAFHPTNGTMYRVYNNKGTYSVTAMYADGNTQLRAYRTATNVELPLAGLSAGTTTSSWSEPSTGSYKATYGTVPNDTSKRATINPSTGKITFNGEVGGTGFTNAVNTLITGKENAGKITIDGVEKTATSHTVTIVTDGVTTTMTLVGVG